MEDNMEEEVQGLASTLFGKVIIWIIAILVAAIFSMGGWVYLLKSDVALAQSNLQTAQAEKISDELQKEALRKGILDQNEAVEKQRIDAEKRAAKFEAESKQIWGDFERTKLEVQNLSGDAECTAIRSIVRKAVQ